MQNITKIQTQVMKIIDQMMSIDIKATENVWECQIAGVPGNCLSCNSPSSSFLNMHSRAQAAGKALQLIPFPPPWMFSSSLTLSNANPFFKLYPQGENFLDSSSHTDWTLLFASISCTSNT